MEHTDAASARALLDVCLAVNPAGKPRDCCAQFAGALLDLMTVDRAEIWVWQRHLDESPREPGSNGPDSGQLRLYPDAAEDGGTTWIAGEHPFISRLAPAGMFVASPCEPDFPRLGVEGLAPGGIVVGLALQDVGALYLEVDEPAVALAHIESGALQRLAAHFAAQLGEILYRRRLEHRVSQLQADIETTEWLASRKTSFGDLAHKFNNVLMAIQGNISYLQLEIPHGHSLRPAVDDIARHIESGAQLSAELARDRRP